METNYESESVNGGPQEIRRAFHAKEDGSCLCKTVSKGRSHLLFTQEELLRSDSPERGYGSRRVVGFEYSAAGNQKLRTCVADCFYIS